MLSYTSPLPPKQGANVSWSYLYHLEAWPHLVAKSVCNGQQPAAGGVGLHIPPTCFCPLFSCTGSAHLTALQLQAAPLLHVSGPLTIFDRVHVWLEDLLRDLPRMEVLFPGTYPPSWPLAPTCSRPLLGLEI